MRRGVHEGVKGEVNARRGRARCNRGSRPRGLLERAGSMRNPRVHAGGLDRVLRGRGSQQDSFWAAQPTESLRYRAVITGSGGH